MKRTIAALLIAGGLPLTACTTAAVVRPVRPDMVRVEGRWVYPPRAGAVWVPAHWEHHAFSRVRVAGYRRV